MGEEAPKRRRRKKLLAAGLSVALTLLVAEIVVRVLVGAPLAERLPIMEIQSNRHRGWMMVPGKDHYTYQHAVEINAHGLRGPEISPKRPDMRRVLALGDSLVYGQGVGERETLPFYLQQALEADDAEGRSWEVINAGHRAYDTRQELALFEEMRAELAPDVVVIFWYWNDLQERDIESTYERLREVEPIAFDIGARAEGWEKVKWHAKQLLRRSALLMYVYDRVGASGDESMPDDRQAGALAKLDYYLSEFDRIAGDASCELCFVVIPDANLIAREHPSAAIADRAVELAEKRGLRTVRPLAALKELHREAGELPVIPYDGHYLPEANRAMAASVARALLER